MSAGDKRHVHSDAFKARFRKLWFQTDPELSCSEIGEALHISKAAVTGLRKRMELAPRGSPIGRERETVKGRRRKSPEPSLRRQYTPEHMRGRHQFLEPRPFPAAPPTAHFDTCQFVTTDQRPWLMCEAPLQPGELVYCAKHEKRCLIEPAKKVAEWRRYPT